MSYSPLVSYYNLSPNRESRGGNKIQGFAIHCFVGQVGVERGVDAFKPVKDASANYVIAYDGKIGCAVDDEFRAWTTSTGLDAKLITIECASDSFHPYKITDECYKSLINLLVDRCKAYGIKKLMWRADKEAALRWDLSTQNMVVHRWFAAKACPGDFLFNLHYQIADEVNKRLGEEPQPTPSQDIYRVQVGAYRVRDNADKVADNLQSDGYSTYIVTVDGLYKVQVGAFASRDNAVRLRDELRGKGYSAFVTEGKRDSKVDQSVVKLQDALNAVYGAGLSVDGVFGDETLAALPDDMSNGDDNAVVACLQEKLNDLGYTLDVDGIFGDVTEECVRDYQSSHGLEVDGIVGKMTWTKLYRIMDTI